MSFSVLPSLLVTAAIALPHIALARYLGFSLSQTIPEPLLSLLLLILISSFSLVFFKPIALDIAVSTSRTSKSRHVASWATSNVHTLAFGVLWNAVLRNQWPPCTPEGEEFVVALRIVSGIVVVGALVVVNSYHNRQYPWDLSVDSIVKTIAAPELEKKEVVSVEEETAKE